MRLKILDRGHSGFQKFVFAVMSTVLGGIAGPVRYMSYRRSFIGKYLAACFQEAMRSPRGEWSIWEREVFAAYVSKLNSCAY